MSQLPLAKAFVELSLKGNLWDSLQKQNEQVRRLARGLKSGEWQAFVHKQEQTARAMAKVTAEARKQQLILRHGSVLGRAAYADERFGLREKAAAGLTAGAGLAAAAVTAASPQGVEALFGWLKVAAAELGMHFLPALRDAVAAVKDFGDWLRGVRQGGGTLSPTAARDVAGGLGGAVAGRMLVGGAGGTVAGAVVGGGAAHAAQSVKDDSLLGAAGGGAVAGGALGSFLGPKGAAAGSLIGAGLAGAPVLQARLQPGYEAAGHSPGAARALAWADVAANPLVSWLRGLGKSPASGAAGAAGAGGGGKKDDARDLFGNVGSRGAYMDVTEARRSAQLAFSNTQPWEAKLLETNIEANKILTGIKTDTAKMAEQKGAVAP